MSEKSKSEKPSRPKIFASAAEYESFAEEKQLQFAAKAPSPKTSEKNTKKKKDLARGKPKARKFSELKADDFEDVISSEKPKARKFSELKADDFEDVISSEKPKARKPSSRKPKTSSKPMKLSKPSSRAVAASSYPKMIFRLLGNKLLLTVIAALGLFGGAIFLNARLFPGKTDANIPKVNEILRQISASPDERDMSQYEKGHNGAYISKAKILVKLIPKSQNINYYLDPELKTIGGVLPAWQPFNIYEFTKNRHLREVVKTKVTKTNEGWVAFDDCFIWNTRVCIHITVNQTLYRTAQELAENLARPESERKPVFFGAYNENLLKQYNMRNRKGEDVVFALPVLFRDKYLEIWKVAMPLWNKKREYVTHYSSMWFKVNRYEEWHKQHNKYPVEPTKGFVRITRSDLNRAIITIYRVINAKRYSQKDLNTLRKLSAALLIKEPKLIGKAMSLNDLYNVGAEIPMPSGLLDRSLPFAQERGRTQGIGKKEKRVVEAVAERGCLG